MSKIIVHKQAYFVPEGRCKKLLQLADRCEAKNQMWQCKKARRDQFLNKIRPYVIAKIANAVYHLGYKYWRLERTGSSNLYDVAEMRNQSYRVLMWGKRDE